MYAIRSYYGLVHHLDMLDALDPGERREAADFLLERTVEFFLQSAVENVGNERALSYNFV